MALNKNYLLIAFGAYALLCWLTFEPMLRALHGHWVRPNDLDAGYLLLAVTCYLYWRAGHQAQPASSSEAIRTRWFDWHTVTASIAFSLCLLIAGLSAITANKSVTLAFLLLGFVPLSVALWGRTVLSQALHGCLILMMATPIWFVLVPMLQALTATAVNTLLQLGHWSVFVQDNMIELPKGTLEIAAGCAGLKFLQTALALSLIEGFWERRNWRSMLVVGLVAGLLAILCNWLRVAAITLLALYLGIDHPWVLDHNWVGWLVFVALLGPLFYWLGRLSLFGHARQTSGVVTGKKGMARAGLALVIGLTSVFAVRVMAEGETSTSIAHAQQLAVRSLCLTAQSDPALGESVVDASHPLPARFEGAQLHVDCALGNNLYLSLRGFVQETQGAEVINPNNELVDGLPMLDFRVTNARNSSNAPGVFNADQLSIAYGFYAAGKWSASPEAFKLRSLARPIYPGPVWALIIVGPSAENDLHHAFDRASLLVSGASPR